MGPGSEQESEPVGRRDRPYFCFGAYLTRVLALWALWPELLKRIQLLYLFIHLCFTRRIYIYSPSVSSL